jgi:hypothetical protein
MIKVAWQLGIELGDKFRIKTSGEVVNGAGTETAEMVMVVATSIIACGLGAVSGRQFIGCSNGNKGLKGLVNCGKADPGYPASHCLEDIFSGGVQLGPAELFVDRETLRRAAQTGGLESLAERPVVERRWGHCRVFSGVHDRFGRRAVAMNTADLCAGRQADGDLLSSTAFPLFGRLTVVSTTDRLSRWAGTGEIR